ncbi:MAG: FAD-binding protein [Coriobacteriales bacterium]|nr:FAD-binding protein [Coriobacteriales bacterium]
MELSRRSFVRSAAAVAAVSSLGNAAFASEAQQSQEPEEVFEYDLVIVGAGGSGLAAAVEAAETGASVVVLERMPYAGGGELGVEGIFGVNSNMQQAEGIHISAGEMVRAELAASQQRASGPAYVDLVHATGENINWLVEHGVTFEGVDADTGTSKLFHRFEGDAGAVGYVPAMEASALNAGAVFMYDTLVDELVQDTNGAVCGVLATDADGRCIQVNALKGVIVATGGFAEDFEMVAKNGFNIANCNYVGMKGHDGTSHRMCLAAGAQSIHDRTAYLAAMSVRDLPDFFHDGRFSFLIGVASPFAVWINENAERFTNEDFAASNVMLMTLPTRGNGDTNIVFDSVLMDIYTGGDEVALEQLQQGLDNGEIKQADSLEELALLMGVAATSLAATIERYNAYCEEGVDEDYGKPAELLIPVAQAPYYAVHITTDVQVSIGSIATNRNFQALDKENNPIEGLYVVGVEGAMLWANVYTMNIAGGCNANNVNSGRTAVRHALGRA